MLEAVDSKVLKLVRIAIGTVKIGDLPIGEWRHLSIEEVRGLVVQAGSLRRTGSPPGDLHT
jgi:16S rRNA U516 pseudouridylate synthase RsuA-like enzyme